MLFKSKLSSSQVSLNCHHDCLKFILVRNFCFFNRSILLRTGYGDQIKIESLWILFMHATWSSGMTFLAVVPVLMRWGRESSCFEGAICGVVLGCAHSLRTQNASSCSLSSRSTTFAKGLSASQAEPPSQGTVAVTIQSFFERFFDAMSRLLCWSTILIELKSIELCNSNHTVSTNGCSNPLEELWPVSIVIYAEFFWQGSGTFTRGHAPRDASWDLRVFLSNGSGRAAQSNVSGSVWINRQPFEC